jgi:hypothetical protein
VPPTPTPAPPAAALDDALLALRPEFAGDVAAQQGRPRYDLRFAVDSAAGTLQGTAAITFANQGSAPLHDVVLRLYPNFPPDVLGNGGNVRMDVTAAAVAGSPVALRYAAQDTAVVLPLEPPLLPGQWRTLEVRFQATMQPWRDGTLPLPSYYPMLARHDGTAWRMDVTDFADHVFAESAFYRAEIVVPAGVQVVTTGSTLWSGEQQPGTTTYRVVSGPVREFAMTIGDFVSVSVPGGVAGDVPVHVSTARGSTLDGAQVAQVAAAALTTYETRFGAYPYRELDIHLLPGQYDGGWEYPGLILLSSDAQVDAGTRYVAAHEVAHQWWYGVVGNDIYREPWLDEAFAQYSAIIYAEDMVGAAAAQADWEREVLQRYRGALADGDYPVGLAITDYPNFNVYYRTVYGKGAVFLRTLRDELGDDLFFQALQHYYARHRYGTGTTASLQQSFEEVSGRSLEPLFRQWVTGG